MATGDKFPVIMAKEKNVANGGVPTLDNNGKISKSQLPDLGIDSAIASHNSNESAHEDIRESIDELSANFEFHSHATIDSENGVAYKVISKDGKINLEIDGAYTEFTVTSGNRNQIGFTNNNGENLVIPAAFIGNDGNTYKVTSIGEYAFENCSRIYTLTIPESVTNIASYAFNNCSAISSIMINANINTIPQWAFNGCNNLGSIIMSDSITIIDNTAFKGCTKLSNITLPKNLERINYSAFENCTALSNIFISNHVTNIGNLAFNGCTKLANVYYAGSEEQWNAITIGENNNPLVNANIYFNCNEKSAYKYINKLTSEVSALKAIHGLQPVSIIE